MNDIKKDHQRLLANLKLLQRVYTSKELEAVIGVSRNTWKAKMEEPWRRFSYDDLRAIARYCRVDFVTLIDGEIKIG